MNQAADMREASSGKAELGIETPSVPVIAEVGSSYNYFDHRQLRGKRESLKRME